MDDAVISAINAQIQREFFASYLYLAMSAHFEDEDLPGFAHWMRMQAKEEVEHAMRLFHYLNRRGARVELEAIEKPPVEFDDPVSIFQAALDHEKKVTGHINDIYELAVQKNDYPTQLELQWFIDEQVEEEDTSGTLVAQMKMVGDNPAALLMLDRQLAERGEGHDHHDGHGH